MATDVEIQKFVQRRHGFIPPAELHLALGEQVVHLREGRAEDECPLERPGGVLDLAVLQQQLTEAEVAQLVVRVVLGHLAELRDPLLQLSHGAYAL